MKTRVTKPIRMEVASDGSATSARTALPTAIRSTHDDDQMKRRQARLEFKVTRQTLGEYSSPSAAQLPDANASAAVSNGADRRSL